MKNFKKILCFDNWTKGIHHFSRLRNSFEKSGYKLILIHLGSWGHDRNRPQEEYIDGVTVRDISFYKEYSFFEIIKKEKPSAILFLWTRSPSFMAFNRCANYLGIPTCHLYHGLTNIHLSSGGMLKYKKFKLNIYKKLYSRMYPIIFKIIPSYISSLVVTKAPIQIWFEFLYELIHRFNIIGSRKRCLADTKTSIGCVYSHSEIKHMNENYCIPLNSIFPVGNPDLTRFNLKHEDYGCKLNNDSNKKIIYIDTGLYNENIIYENYEKFISHICQTKNEVEKLGFEFAIKLKPHSYFATKEGISQLRLLNIEICDDNDFLPQLKKCKAVITEPSSAAIVPAALGLLIFLASYGQLSGMKYGTILRSYPRAKELTLLSLLSSYLSNNSNKKSDHLSHNEWIKHNLGPFPAEKMPERVVNAIKLKINLKNTR